LGTPALGEAKLALSSSSTLTDALAQLNNNLIWEGNTTKVQDFVEAARWLVFNRPQITSNSGASVNYEQVERQLKDAEDYLAKAGKASTRSNFTRGKALLP
jgi:hypothetical protein